MHGVRQLSAGWVLAALCVAAVAGPCSAQIPDSVLNQTLLISGASGGTAFVLDVDGRQYLVTAKHVVADVDNAVRVAIGLQRKNGQSQTIQVIVYKCDDPVDIAILIPPEQIASDPPLEPDLSGLAVGQDAYFTGYTGDFLGQRNLLVRKGAVDRFERPGRSPFRQILLDAHATPGLSGSPLIYRSKNGSGFSVAGVITAFQAEEAPVLRRKEVSSGEFTNDERLNGQVVYDHGKWYRFENSGDKVRLNTGIAIAWDITAAVELIRRHPLGPKVFN